MGRRRRRCGGATRWGGADVEALWRFYGDIGQGGGGGAAVRRSHWAGGVAGGAKVTLGGTEQSAEEGRRRLYRVGRRGAL